MWENKLLVVVLGLAFVPAHSALSTPHSALRLPPSALRPPPSVLSPDWPMFRGDAALSGVAATDLPKTPQLLWQYPAGEAVESTAAIVGDTVYIGAMDKTEQDLVGVLHAIDLNTGTDRWKYQTGLGIKASPCVHAGRVYVGDGDGTFHAVDATSGKQLWTFATDAEIISSATYADGRVLFGSYDQWLYCLAADDGKLLWKVATAGYVHATPAVAEGKVFVSGCDEFLHVVDLEKGTELGKISLSAPTGASPVVSGESLFVGTYGNEVLRLNWQTGQILWRYNPPQADFPFFSCAALSDGLVVVGGRDRSVHALKAQTGEAVWTFPTRGRVDSSPVIVGERVLVGSADGNLYALDMKTGKETWRFTAAAEITASPAIKDGRLVIGAGNGTVYCFGAR